MSRVHTEVVFVIFSGHAMQLHVYINTWHKKRSNSFGDFH